MDLIAFKKEKTGAIKNDSFIKYIPGILINVNKTDDLRVDQH